MSYEVVQQTLAVEARKYVLKEAVVATCDGIANAVRTAASLAKTRRTGKTIPVACFMVRAKAGESEPYPYSEGLEE